MSPVRSSMQGTAALTRRRQARPIRARAALAVVAAIVAMAPAAALAQAEPVKVAAQADRSSARLVIEWRRPVTYTVNRTGTYIFVRFSRPFSGDVEAARGALGRYLSELRVAGGGRVLVMRVAGEPRFVHRRRGNAVVLSWIGAGRAAPPMAEGPTDSGTTPEKPKPKIAREPAPARPAQPPEPRAEQPPLPQAEAPPAPTAPRAEETKPPPMAKAPDPAPPKPEIRPAPEARPAPEGPIEPPVMPAISPTLTVTSNGVETRVVLAWPEPVAAAVFRYGDNVWMVFPRREAFDLEPFQRMLGPGVERLTRIEHAQATVLAARARVDVRARVIHERNVWTVVLKRENGAVTVPDVKIAISRGNNEQVAVPLPGAEAPIRLVDPDIGSTLHVIPSRAVAGLGGERGFVTFRLLPAMQGGVVEALADGVVVAAEGAAVTIRRNGGLLLSNGGPPGSSQHGQ